MLKREWGPPFTLQDCVFHARRYEQGRYEQHRKSYGFMKKQLQV